MTEPEKANWGNRIILLIFGALAIVTIVGTIWSTTAEWGAGEVAGPTAVEDSPVMDSGNAPDERAI
ncbi:hypothetical protein [Pelagibacterium lacus]|uniref:Uncharacterized protein n=1 Tax=Pelagibacterium lacus TaxID=2282655 RepID=A0A369W0N7_9HYPH|nr:hypothetical protein [Pelagibacterium lacus]RDE08234.1 hypothetical protein DVH29_12425 [Pelagibacterium lacus]